MRPHYLVFALALSVGTAFASPPASIYSFVDASNAQACAQACNDDALCAAWQFTATKCGLSAVSLGASQDSAVVTGVSVNAPRFMRTAATAAAAPAPEPKDVAAAEVAPLPEAPHALDDTHAEAALLGGPDDSAIRTRLQ